jgi:regulator of sirC expression with transglutaminase-like and TPR domain
MDLDAHLLQEFAAETDGPDAEIDLARAALAIARGEYPDLDVGTYLGRLDDIARGVERRGRRGNDLACLHRVREYLFAELGFAGNRAEYADPRNSFLNDVLDRRLGIPITLSLVLIEVARRVGLAAAGIGLPGHFITGVRLADGSQIFLDPFSRGSIVTAEECQRLAARALGRPVTLGDEHWRPVTNRQFLSRMLTNLKIAYWKAEDWTRAVRVIDRLLVLNPGAAGEWRDRGAARHNLGEYRESVADWERYLTACPDARDHEAILGHLRRARHRVARLN